VQLPATQAIACAEALYLALDVLFLALESYKLGVALGERTQIVSNERAHRATALGRSDSRGTVDVI
jgi:hypothetical protein